MSEFYSLCIDQIFIKNDYFLIDSQAYSLTIVISSAENYFEDKTYDLQFNKPLKLEISHKMLYSKTSQSKVDISIFTDEIILTSFEFIFKENILTSLNQFIDNNQTFVRLIVRAFKPNAFKFKIGDLHEYKMSDFDINSLREIGKGSYGSVYYAEELETGRGLALKSLLLPDIQNNRDPSIREVLPFISIPYHPSIIRIFGYIFNSNQFIIVLEFCKLGSLHSFLPLYQSTLTKFQNQKLIYSMIHCLGYLHSFGLIHRDISPSNILISDNFECKIIDFSISRFNDEPDLTQFQGNVKFMAPEIKIGKEYGKEADYFSVSKLIYDNFQFEQYYDLYQLIFELNITIDDPDDRLSFDDILNIFESNLNDREMENYMERIKLETSYNIQPFSLDKILDFSTDLILTDENMLLGFASELIKVGANETTNNIDFENLFHNLMTVGCVAFDVELMVKYIKGFNKDFNYDKGRMMYRINMFFFQNFKDCFLEFDEQIGFKASRYIDKENVWLGFFYHYFNISTLENDSQNTYLSRIIDALDNKDIEFVFEVFDELTSKPLVMMDVLLALFASLADAGYVNMAFEAWKRYSIEKYGFEKAKKYLEMAIDYSDQKSIEFYNSHKQYFETKEKFIVLVNLQNIERFILDGDIDSSIFPFFDLFNLGKAGKKYKFKPIEYFITLGFIHLFLEDIDYSLTCFKQAGDVGAFIAKFIELNRFMSPNSLKNCLFELVGSHISILYKIAEFYVKLRNEIKEGCKDCEIFYL